MRANPWMWIAVAAPGFAAGFPITKVLFESGLDVWQIMLPRFGIAASAVTVVMLWRRNHVRTAWRGGILLGITNIAIPSVLIGVGTDLLPASVAGILTAFMPLATAAAAHWIVAGERFTASRLPGALVAVAGVGALVIGDNGAGGRITWTGIAVTLVGVAMAGVGGALNRRITLAIGVRPVIVPQYAAALLATALVAVPLGGADLRGVTGRQVLWLVALGLVSTVLPFIAILKAFELTTAARAALVGYLVPMIAAIMSIVALSEPVTVSFALGGVLIITGVVVADRSERRIPVTPPL